MPLPAVLTIQSGINQLRYATLKGIMAAKKKEIRVVPAPQVPRRSSASWRSTCREGQADANDFGLCR
jgi:electron transfer flavoprotein alpha/beta subunit